MQEHGGAVVQLGITPRYLDPHCHEALYEVDVGVNEARDRPEGDVSSREGARAHKLSANSTCASQEESIVHE